MENNLEDVFNLLLSRGCHVNELKSFDLTPISHYTITSPISNKLVTGLRSLEQVTGGIEAGTIDLLAAPTGVGKTTMALSLAKLQCKLGKKCCYVSTEMNERDIYKKTRYCRHEDFNGLDFIPLDDNTDIKYLIDCMESIIKIGQYDVIYFDYINSATLYYSERTVPQDQLITILLQKFREMLDGTKTHLTCFSQTNRSAYTYIPDQNIVQGSASAANKVDLGANFLKCKDKYASWIRTVENPAVMPNIIMYIYKNRASEHVDCILPLIFDYKNLEVTGGTIIESDRIHWKEIL